MLPSVQISENRSETEILMYIFSSQKARYKMVGCTGRSADGWGRETITSDPGTSEEVGKARMEPYGGQVALLRQGSFHGHPHYNSYPIFTFKC